MAIQIARHVAAIKSSETLTISAAVNAKKATEAAKGENGRNIINLVAGEPVFPIPSEFADGIVAAVRANKILYTAVAGIDAYRAAVVRDLEERYGLGYNKKQVLISSGAKQAQSYALKVILNPGDKVGMFSPHWLYADMVRLQHGIPVSIPCSPENDYKPTAESVYQARAQGVKIFILTNPNNPTGSVMSADELREFGEAVAEDPDAILFADEIYSQISFVGPIPSILNLVPKLKGRTILIDGVSKTYGVTGLRSGWAIGPEDFIARLESVQSHMSSGACSIVQEGAIEMLNSPQRGKIVQERCRIFKERRDLLSGFLETAPGITVFEAQGAFYQWCKIEKELGYSSDKQFVMDLLEETGIGAVHGTPFGAPGHFRVHFAAGEDDLKIAGAEIVGFCERRTGRTATPRPAMAA